MNPNMTAVELYASPVKNRSPFLQCAGFLPQGLSKGRASSGL
jgi:hypothetical protein